MATVNSNRVANQGVWIGAGFTSEDDSGPFLPAQVGSVVTKGEKTYQRVQFKSTSSALAAGTPVMWSDMANFVVSAKVSDSKRNQPAGFALGAPTAGNWGWIQVNGPITAAVTGGVNSGVSGDVFVMGSSDGTILIYAAGTAPAYIPMLVATGTEAASAVNGNIVVPHNGW